MGRGETKLERLFRNMWKEISPCGYPEAELFIEWLFKQELPLLYYCRVRFYVNKETEDKIFEEYIDYVITHKELIRVGFNLN